MNLIVPLKTGLITAVTSFQLPVSLDQPDFFFFFKPQTALRAKLRVTL